MDTSETYIKMSDCPEIQEQKPEYAREDKEFRYIKDGGDYIWIPRQDQLQEMFNDSPHEIVSWIMDFCYGMKTCEYSQQFASMEQLWLAFVMKEKYNKIWDGENWVKEK